MIRTVIAEDNQYMLNHLKALVQRTEGFELAGAVTDAFEAEALCESGEVDLVLMDVQTATNNNGLAAGERIRASGNGAKVLVVTSLIDPDVLNRARMGAADSLWYKDHGDEDLMDVARRTVAGERIFPDTSPSVERKGMRSGDISPRQLLILRRFVQGATYEEIAAELGITKNGVRWNLDQIAQKGGFANKHEMLATVIENKLIVTTLKDS
jgi:DNA-binding NarL/FixJ family response regulator